MRRSRSTSRRASVSSDDSVVSFKVNPIRMFPLRGRVFFGRRKLGLILDSVTLPKGSDFSFRGAGGMSTPDVTGASLRIVNDTSFLSDGRGRDLVRGTEFLFRAGVLRLVRAGSSRPSPGGLVCQVTTSRSERLSVVFGSLVSVRRAVFSPGSTGLMEVVSSVEDAVTTSACNFCRYAFRSALGFFRSRGVSVPSSNSRSLLIRGLFFRSVGGSASRLREVGV